MSIRLSHVARLCGAALVPALLLMQGTADAQVACCIKQLPPRLVEPLSIERTLGPHAWSSVDMGLGGVNAFGSAVHTETDLHALHAAGYYNQGTPPANQFFDFVPGLVVTPPCPGFGSVTITGSRGAGVNGAGMAAATGGLALSASNASPEIGLVLSGGSMVRMLCPYRADPGASSAAIAINDYGVVAGVSKVPGWSDLPMLWSAWNTSGLGTPIDLYGTGIPAFAKLGARPTAINRGSTVVGWAKGDAVSNTVVRGWLKRPDRPAVAVLKGTATTPAGINDSGIVVGNATDGVSRAFAWQPEVSPGHWTWLPAAAGGGMTEALAVSNEGSTVAGSCGGRACYWAASCTALATGGRSCTWAAPVMITMTTLLPVQFYRVLAIADTADTANRDELMLVEGSAQGFDGMWTPRAWVVRRRVE